jgi:hypothetical protein
MQEEAKMKLKEMKILVSKANVRKTTERKNINIQYAV